MARWSLTGGQVHDSGQAVPLLEGLEPGAVVADKAYDANALIEHIEESGATAVIPPRSNRLEQRSFDKHQYKHRNLIERFFLRIKQFRRIATRYDKLAERFSAFIAIVAAFLWLT
jgi:transposase